MTEPKEHKLDFAALDREMRRKTASAAIGHTIRLHTAHVLNNNVKRGNPAAISIDDYEPNRALSGTWEVSGVVDDVVERVRPAWGDQSEQRQAFLKLRSASVTGERQLPLGPAAMVAVNFDHVQGGIFVVDSPESGLPTST